MLNILGDVERCATRVRNDHNRLLPLERLTHQHQSLHATAHNQPHHQRGLVLVVAALTIAERILHRRTQPELAAAARVTHSVRPRVGQDEVGVIRLERLATVPRH